MNQEEFEDIQKLLRLKRHENPPPGYFRDFSNGVMAKVRKLEAEKPRSWWQRWMAPWSQSARLAWANSLTVVGLGIVGFSLYFSSVSDTKPEPAIGGSSPQLGGVGFVSPQSNQRSQSGSLLFVAEPVEFEAIRIRSVPIDQTNPFPQGLFELPGNHSVRVGFGTPR